MADIQLNYTGAQINTLLAKVDTIVNIVYPVGSIYMSVTLVDPAALFGGTWERIQDTFLLAAGTTYSAGASGGNATHTISQGELPAHTHGLNSHTHEVGTYSVSSVGDHAHTAYGWALVKDGSGSYVTLGGAGSSATYSTRGAGGHGHTLSGVSGEATGNTTSVGEGESFSILPPYLAVYVWKRTA